MDHDAGVGQVIEVMVLKKAQNLGTLGPRLNPDVHQTQIETLLENTQGDLGPYNDIDKGWLGGDFLKGRKHFVTIHGGPVGIDGKTVNPLRFKSR